MKAFDRLKLLVDLIRQLYLFQLFQRLIAVHKWPIMSNKEFSKVPDQLVYRM